MASQQHTDKMAASAKETKDVRCPLQVPVKMEVPCQAGGGNAREGEGKRPAVIPSAAAEDLTRGSSRVKQEGPPQSWECQWQRVLEVVPAPLTTPVWDNLQLPPLTQGGSTEAYLATFERVADASQWPREEWVTRLVPVLNGQAQQAYFSLDTKDKGDYGKVKVAILRLDDYFAMEMRRQNFRHFCYRDADGPRTACRQLQELCRCWLRPESRSKEQILDLLVLEQFLIILPQEMQDWVRERGPETCDRAMALAEEYLQEQQEAERWAQEVTIPTEMVIVNSSIVAQAHPEAKPLHREDQQVDTGNSIPQEVRFAQTGAREVHQEESEAEEAGWWTPGECGRALFLKGSPRRSQVSTCDLERQPKGCLSARIVKDKGLGRVLTDPEAKRHLCKECGRRFRKKWDLIRHERIHTGEKPYQCPECGNSFNRNTTLTKHLLIHSGEKPHQCTNCGKRFTRRSHVVNHQRRHSCQGRS